MVDGLSHPIIPGYMPHDRILNEEEEILSDSSITGEFNIQLAHYREHRLGQLPSIPNPKDASVVHCRNMHHAEIIGESMLWDSLKKNFLSIDVPAARRRRRLRLLDTCRHPTRAFTFWIRIMPPSPMVERLWIVNSLHEDVAPCPTPELPVKHGTMKNGTLPQYQPI
jgi:hypothetical protein